MGGRRRFPVVNMQGSLSNPNPAIEAAKAGDVSRIPTGPSQRVDERAIADARAAGLIAIGVTVGHVAGPLDPVAVTDEEIAAWHAFARERSADVALVRSTRDIDACLAASRIGIILGFQNSEMLIDDPERVGHYADLGVRVMQLTYNGANRAGAGCLAPIDEGLADFGRAIVAAMNARGVLVDGSHAGARTLRSTIEASARPIAFTHAGCRALADHPRNVADADLRLLAERGGVLGIYAMPFLRTAGQPHLADYVAHVEHAIQVCGEDHVALGTDGTITPIDDVAAYKGFLADEIAERRKAGVAAPGEAQAVALFLPDMQGPSQFAILAEALARRGHSERRIEKILGGNWVPLLRDAWVN